jgi:hypothetical protein
MKDLLKAKDILKDDKQSINILQPKVCPSCKEPNRPDAFFCFKCNFVMSFEVYQKGLEEKEKKDQEISELKEQMSKVQQDFKSYDESVKEVLEKVKQEREWQKKEEERRKVMYDTLDRLSPGWEEPYHATLRRPLTEEKRKKIEEFRKQMEALPDDSEDIE